MEDATQFAAPRRVRRRGHVRTLFVVACIAVAALAGPSVQAQRLSVSLHGERAASSRVATTTLAVTSLRAGDFDLDAWFRIGARAGAPPVGAGGAPPWRVGSTFGVGAAGRRVTTFGQLGNVTVEGGGSLAAPGDGPLPLAGRLWLGARGTVATIALTLALEAGNASPRTVDPARPPPPDAAGREALGALDDQRERARIGDGAWDLGARLGVVYRLDRTTTLDLAASARSLAGAAAVAMSLELGAAAVAGDLDGRFGVRLERLADTTAGAVGLGIVDAPRRGPTSWAQAWLGVGAAGVWPGLEGRWATRALPGDLAVHGSWRPWLSTSAWTMALEYRHDLAQGDLLWLVDVAGIPDGGAAWTATVRWERPW